MKRRSQMSRRIKALTFIIFILVAVEIIAGGYVRYRFSAFEQQQHETISALESQVSDLENQVSALDNIVSLLSAELISIKSDNTVWRMNDYNYLAIGNSITLHGLASYWWNPIGMAASDKDHDYYHLVLNYLSSIKENVHGEVFNFYVWETQSTDRDETLTMLDSYLDNNIDLISIQLGENSSDLSTFERDYESLIAYIKAKAPNARIIVVGDFWEKQNRDELKRKAAENTGVEYVSLEGIKGNAEYYCGLGTVVYDEEGNEHIVDHGGVADHPGDNGMRAIAERIIEVLK